MAAVVCVSDVLPARTNLFHLLSRSRPQFRSFSSHISCLKRRNPKTATDHSCIASTVNLRNGNERRRRLDFLTVACLNEPLTDAKDFCADTGKAGRSESALEKAGEILFTLFPLWVSAGCIAALLRPSAFLWIRGSWQITGLTLTMIGMGMTLSMKDLQDAVSMPKELLGGVFLQYTVMPTAGALISRLLKLPSHYAAGLILVACCPGGTASNVVTYIARCA
eukprot:TRINITY_DN5326_c0_g1_i1.p1 TRINITY_DN5326_c0_g1~~TRINITY_DN5326_c0_g1_i1.p1  ORF type:complete len:222 (+),score=23.74 TRINITY_DN5326_c0_g1_i1:114-779(+)